MSRLLFVLSVIALIVVALSVGAPVTHAGYDVTCSASPSAIGPGETTYIKCSGFTPNTMLWLYLVEPDGTAFAPCGVRKGGIDVGPNQPNGEGIGPGCEYKSDEYGNVYYAFTNGFLPYVTYSVGEWRFVFEQLGPGHSIVHQGYATVLFKGGNEGVSGATLLASKNTLSLVYNIGFKTSLSELDYVALLGTGFAPWEIVTLWVEFPSPCSSFTVPINVFDNGKSAENVPEFEPLHTVHYDDVKADANGSFVDYFGLPPFSCSGQYKIVARGNASGRGAFVYITALGGSVTENATLIASKSAVMAVEDKITFAAAGFAPNETLSCWETSPEGRAIAYLSGKGGSFRVDGSGSALITLYTGSFRLVIDIPNVISIDEDFHTMSHGSLGVWALSCRGDQSGKTGIAHFTLIGGPTDP